MSGLREERCTAAGSFRENFTPLGRIPGPRSRCCSRFGFLPKTVARLHPEVESTRHSQTIYTTEVSARQMRLSPRIRKWLAGPKSDPSVRARFWHEVEGR